MKHFILELTCFACPEQYDVYLDGKQVGYLRLRNGIFRCDYPDCGGETIYRACPAGDGIFDSDERDKYLSEAIATLASKLDIKDFEYKVLVENENPFDFL